MDAVAPSEPAAKQVDVALADLNKALKGLEWSAEFSRLSGDPAAESLTALWQVLGHAEAVLEDQPWPAVDESALVRDSLTLAVQVNGKLRGTIEVPASASREEAEALALAQPQVAAFLKELTVRKVIVVPGKIVNIVAG